jgi:hypothetical protein
MLATLASQVFSIFLHNNNIQMVWYTPIFYDIYIVIIRKTKTIKEYLHYFFRECIDVYTNNVCALSAKIVKALLYSFCFSNNAYTYIS